MNLRCCLISLSLGPRDDSAFATGSGIRFVFTSSCFAFKSFSSSRVSVSRSADVLYMDGYLWNVFVSPDVAQFDDS